jgi:predicted P-loop ATPase
MTLAKTPPVVQAFAQPSLEQDFSQTSKFLELLGKPQDAAWVRYLDPLKKKPSGADQHWFGSDQDLEKLQKRQFQGFNAYLIIGNGTTATGIHKSTGKPSGAQADWDITHIPALFVEWDKKPIEWQINAWKELGLPEPSIQVHTGGKSVHNYWVLDEPMAPDLWRALIKRLIAHCGADTNNCNPSRLMRLPGSVYHDKDKGGAATGIAEIIHSSERRYSAAEIEACLPPVLAKAAPKAAASSRFAAPSSQWEPRTEADLINALRQVPAFDHDQGRREELLGLAFRLTAEIGAERGLQLMQEHSPAVNDIASYFNTQPTQINAGSIWAFLREHYNVNISRTSQKLGTARSYTKPVKAKTENLIDKFDLGWEENARGEVVRRKLKSGDLAGLLEIHTKDNLRFNELSLYAEYNNKTVTSSELEHFYIQLSERGYTIPKKDAADCLIYKAKQQSYHPVREYLNHIKANNDVVPADISNLASKYLNATNPLHDTMLRKTLIGAVARVMEPGCKFDTCLVLAGATGIGKSTFFKTLASPAWFCDTAQEQDKDLKMLIHSTWIYELAELETKTGKKEAGEIKALLSGSTDKFRAPYAAAMEDHDRKSIFVATCNRRDFLRDETGSRRYWVIPVPNAMHEKIDVTGLLENRDAIWKAAVLAYINGEKTFLDIPDELQSEQENKEFEPENIWLAPMEHWLSKLRTEPQFTTAQALIGAGLRQRDHLSSDDQRRAAHVLRELGYVQTKNPKRVDGSRARLWELGTDGTDGTDQNKGSVPPETDCTGIDPSVLAQITDKKAKTFEFLSTEGIEPPPPAPYERERTEKSAKDLCICATTMKPVALQPITPGTDPKNDLCQAPTSVPGKKPLNGSDTNAIDRNQLEQRTQTTINLMGLSDAEMVGSGADVDASGDDPHWPARAPAR